MEITILGFGIAKDILGAHQITLTIETNATVTHLRRHLEEHYPRLAQIKSYVIAVNHTYALPDSPLHPTDEVAIIPPVSGG